MKFVSIGNKLAATRENCTEKYTRNYIPFVVCTHSLRSIWQLILTSDNDVVDGDMDQFDEEPNEAHDAESNSGCSGNLLKFFTIRFGASFD